MQDADTVTDRGCDRGGVRGLAVAATIVGVALLIAGCGGSGPSPGVATIAGSQSAGGQSATTPSAGGSSGPATSARAGSTVGFAISSGDRQTALKLAACMRANGVPNFPDPDSQGEIQGSGIDPGSPSFQTAQQKCAKYTPHGGQPPSPAQQAQAQAQALKYSACMRTHGEPSFPDPQFSSGGGISIRIHAGPGSGGSALDPGSPIFQAAQKACGSILPGKTGGGPPPVAVGNKAG
jgi:hypothetical protein